MSKYSAASFSVFLVDGYNLIASIMDTATMSRESITQQTNPFGVANQSNTPVGLYKGSLAVGNGFFDPATDALHSAIAATTGIARIICAAIEGNTIGKHFLGFQGPISAKYDIIDAKEDLLRANVMYQMSGAIDYGLIVLSLQTFTANWDTKTGGAGSVHAPVDNTLDTEQRNIPITSNSIANPTVVTTTVPHGRTTGDVILISGVITSSPTINGQQTVTVLSPTTFSVPVNVTVAGTGGSFVPASTSAGGVGYCQCDAYSGFTNVVPKIMHSVDDVTYAALITFTTITAANTKERLTVAGVVNRYLSSDGVVTGAGSLELFMGFSRN